MIIWKDIKVKSPPKNKIVLCKGSRYKTNQPLVYLAIYEVPNDFEAKDGFPLLMMDNDGCGFTVTCQPTHWTEWNDD